MAFGSFSFPVITAGVIITLSGVVFAMRRFQTWHAQLSAEKSNEPSSTRPISETARRLVKNLPLALPDSIILPTDVEAFETSINAYWAKQESEAVLLCVISPRTADQLSTAVTILKREYDEHIKNTQDSEIDQSGGLFAIRSGGHSPVARSASIEKGVLIELSHLSDVLDAKNLAVAGGRNSDVGVGGLVLGGGISFFSQKFGLVCSNILSYEIVLASGSITTASASTNPDLWRALKGGGNNFGIVTHITVCSFPSTNIWSGFLYMPSGQSAKVLSAFHDFVDGTGSNGPNTGKLGIQAIAVNLVCTKSLDNPREWPKCWKESSFKPLWRLWSMCKVRSLGSACDEMNTLNPPGRRQAFGTTTIKNDPATIQAAYNTYNSAITSIKRANIEGMSWTLVLQPILPDWVNKGDANPLGLHDMVNEPLVLINFTVNWEKCQDDELVEKLTRESIERINAFAAGHGTAHRYRYMNYCGSWQRPFESYGEENLEFLQNTSRRYDPDRLFQRGCVGGFKL